VLHGHLRCCAALQPHLQQQQQQQHPQHCQLHPAAMAPLLLLLLPHHP
jgi:hypothetical protein